MLILATWLRSRALNRYRVPSSWSGSRRPEAVLHQRIVAAVAGLRSVSHTRDATAVWAGLASVERQAARLDQQLVAISHMTTRFKLAALKDVATTVRQLERVSNALINQGSEIVQGEVAAELDLLSEHLKLLAAARAELDDPSITPQKRFEVRP